MLHQSAHLADVKVPGNFMTEIIKSRFGDVTVDTEKAVSFPRGLLGMPDKQRFALAGFPNPKMQQFTLLQSLDDTALSFITLPLEVHNAIIASDDVLAACRDLQFDPAKLALLLIVTIHRAPGQVRLSVNARAPVFVDSERRIGIQQVLPQDHYKVQHML